MRKLRRRKDGRPVGSRPAAGSTQPSGFYADLQGTPPARKSQLSPEIEHAITLAHAKPPRDCTDQEYTAVMAPLVAAIGRAYHATAETCAAILADLVEEHADKRAVLAEADRILGGQQP